MTRLGPLDLLGNIGANRGYDELLPDTEIIELSPRMKIRLLTLAKLIEVKGESAQEKDRAALAVLRQTLKERSTGKD